MNFLVKVIAVLTTISAVSIVNIQGSEHIHLSDNFMVTYTVTPANGTQPRWVVLEIEAKNISGWLGIGVNSNNSRMPGADMFIGGVKGTNEYWGADYFVPSNATVGNGYLRPFKDKAQDWIPINGTRNGTNVTIRCTRKLDTGDKAEDVVITDKKMYLIWAYNNVSDDPIAKHTYANSQQITWKISSGVDKTTFGVGTVILGAFLALTRK